MCRRQGDVAVPRRRGLRPCTLLGGVEARSLRLQAMRPPSAWSWKPPGAMRRRSLDGGLVVAPCAVFSGGWLGLRREAPKTHRLPRFWKQGDSLYPRRGLRPCTLLGGRGRRFLAFRRVWREGQDAPAGRVVLLWLALFFSGGAGLACAVVPPAHPHVSGNRGSPPALPAEGFPAPSFEGDQDEAFGRACGRLAVAPARVATCCAVCLGSGLDRFACGLRRNSFSGGRWVGVRRCPTWPTLRRFWKQGDSPPVPPAGAAPLHPERLLGRASRRRWRSRPACASLPSSTPCSNITPGTRKPLDFLAFPRVQGQGQSAPGGGAAPAPRLGRRQALGSLCHTHTPISARWLSSVSAQTRASRRSGLAPLSGVQVQSWSSRSSRPGPTWKTLPCS